MKPILCDTSKTLEQIQADTSNGLGRLDVTRAVVVEERNGIYELEFDIPTTDIHFKDMSIGGIVKVTGSQGSGFQMFRIYAIDKPINEICTVYAQHITYDLNKIAVKPFKATGIRNALNGLKTNMMGTYPFTFSTNIDNTTSAFALVEPHTLRECLGGMEGSLLDVFSSRGSGEFTWDNLNIEFNAHRGVDRGVTIRYGKNLVDFKQEESIENVYDAIVGYATENDETTTGDVQNITGATFPRTMIVDFSNEFDDETKPTKARLNTKARQYAERNNINVPSVNLEVSFVNLAQTEEYKDIAPLEEVRLCDTVHVVFPSLNVEASSKVIRTEWNVLMERYDSIELGDAKSTISSTIQDSFIEPLEKKNDAKASSTVDEMNQMAQLILNGLGLFKTEVRQDNGSVKYYMHNRPTLAESPIQYVIGENGFMLSRDYGRTWTSGIDSEGNAVFNSLSANEIKAMNIYGSTIDGSEFISEHRITSDQVAYMRLWSGVFEQQVNSYVRSLIYTNDNEAYLVLEGGQETDGNVIPPNDYRNVVSKNSITMTKGGTMSAVQWMTDDAYHIAVGDSFLSIYKNGAVGVYRDTSKFEISADGGMYMQGANGYLELKQNGKLVVDVKSLDVFFNGLGYTDLGFVNDGNGHAVLGK